MGAPTSSARRTVTSRSASTTSTAPWRGWRSRGSSPSGSPTACAREARAWRLCAIRTSTASNWSRSAA